MENIILRSATMDPIFMEYSQTLTLMHHYRARIFKHALEVFEGVERNTCRFNSRRTRIVIGIAAGTSLQSMKLLSPKHRRSPLEWLLPQNQ